MNRALACALIGAGVLASGSLRAQAPDLADPTPLAAAFRDICLPDFPNIDTVGRKAVAAGWVERTVTITGGPPGPGMSATNLPRFFQGRGLTLVLSRPGGGMQASCQVSAVGAREVTVARLAAALRPDTPRLEKRRGEERAIWTQGAAEVSASIGGRVRNLTYLTRIPPEQSRQ